MFCCYLFLVLRAFDKLRPKPTQTLTVKPLPLPPLLFKLFGGKRPGANLGRQLIEGDGAASDGGKEALYMGMLTN